MTAVLGRRPGWVARALILAAVAGLAGGCKKNEPAPTTVPSTAPPAEPQKKIQVTKVELGKELGTDKRVKAPSTSFSKKDTTIFASVVTEGSGGPAELGARWTFQDGQLVNDTKRTIAPSTALAVTEFSIQKPDGWPAGDYKVEITLDGKAVDTKAFRVQ